MWVAVDVVEHTTHRLVSAGLPSEQMVTYNDQRVLCARERHVEPRAFLHESQLSAHVRTRHAVEDDLGLSALERIHRMALDREISPVVPVPGNAPFECVSLRRIS